jgi:hypothetical protein
MAVNLNKIVVLILSTNNTLYDEFKQSIRNGWASKLKEYGVEYFFYSGDHVVSEISADDIRLTVPDGLEYTSLKLIRCIDLLLKYRPDTQLIYRTNLSSFIDVGNFIEFIKANDLNIDTYTGLIGKTNYLKEYFYGNRVLQRVFSVVHFKNNIIFASGSGFFLGKDYFVKLVNTEANNLKYIDDVMVSLALKIQPNSSLSPLRFDIDEKNKHKVSQEYYDLLVTKNLLFHYRFKTSNRLTDAKMILNFSNEKYRRSICVREKKDSTC